MRKPGCVWDFSKLRIITSHLYYLALLIEMRVTGYHKYDILLKIELAAQINQCQAHTTTNTK